MKKRFLRQELPIAMASGLVVLFAGCQVSPVTKAPIDEGTVNTTPHLNPKPGQATSTGETGGVTTSGQTGGTTGATGATGNGSTSTPTVNPDAKVTGTVLDMNGQPISGLTVNAVNGFKATTDSNGKFSIDVAGQDNLRLDFYKDGYVERQEMVSVQPGGNATVKTNLEPLDPKVSHVSASAGGDIKNSDGSSELIIPPGALKSDGDVRLTWMDPMPSDAFPVAYGQLPGPLVTRTLPDGTQASEDRYIPPLAFTAVDMLSTDLAPGAQATLRMKVNPAALDLSKDSIDFNNPASLQQPCYDYDRSRGLWVNPATSKLEKDPDGTVWFVYTLRGSDNPKNYFDLSTSFGLLQTITQGNYVTGQQTITWQETVMVPVVRHRPGGGTTTVMVPQTVTRSKVVDLYGKLFTGQVKEVSSNSALNGAPLANALVRHQTDFFGGTTKVTNQQGNFTLPMWHNTSSATVFGSSYYTAQSSGGGFNMTINTDSHLTVKLVGDWSDKKYGEDVTFQYKVDGVTKSETIKFTPGHDWTFSRDVADDMNNWELVGADSATTRFIPKPEDPPVKVDLRPGDNKTIEVKMLNKEAK